jgi:pyridoxine 5-phosphate synthase
VASLRLGVNVDHVATVRNARGGALPDPVRAALTAIEAGADGITAHLREDRRHIRDDDMARLKREISKPLNFEMAATEQMLDIALRIKPHACCLVPEKRTERTTEGGLDVIGDRERLTRIVPQLAAVGIRVSMFIGPDPDQVREAKAVGAHVVELHTGAYADTTGPAHTEELRRLTAAAKLAHEIGLEVHAGHGLTFDNVGPVAALPQVVELNIGHFLVGEALFVGLVPAIKEMRLRIALARNGEALR